MNSAFSSELDSLTPLDPYEQYAAMYDPEYEDGEVKVKAQAKTNAERKRKRLQAEVVAQLTDSAQGLEAGFETTYKPARYESEWLLSSLRSFYDQALIVDVLSQVKGGKEASVYRCAAHPSIGAPLVAAKVYRPRKFRNLRNDKLYREGRSLIDIDGKTPKERDTRLKRAMEKGSAFGSQMAHTSWLMHEYTTLETLHAAGGAVPRPIASSENALLMQFHGDAGLAAPTLHEVTLGPSEAETLFLEVMNNIELMLTCGLIHGDLSAYNILYWQGTITLIDFPQVVSVEHNPHARALLHRDIRRVCDYFLRQNVPCDPDALAADLWQRYSSRRPADEAADWSRAVGE